MYLVELIEFDDTVLFNLAGIPISLNLILIYKYHIIRLLIIFCFLDSLFVKNIYLKIWWFIILIYFCYIKLVELIKSLIFKN